MLFVIVRFLFSLVSYFLDCNCILVVFCSILFYCRLGLRIGLGAVKEAAAENKYRNTAGRGVFQEEEGSSQQFNYGIPLSLIMSRCKHRHQSFY